MNLDGLASTGAAQRSLARLLKTAYADEQRAAVAIEQAMRAANLDALPEDSVELLTVVKQFLVPLMTPEVGPRLVAALIDDLEAEIEHERALGDPFSSSRIAVSTKMPPPGEEPVESEVRMPTARAPSIDELAKPEDLVPTPSPPYVSRMDAETSEYEVPAALRDAPPPPSLDAPLDAPLDPAFDPPLQPTTRRRRAHVVRPAVAVVDGDRFGRSSLARALVQAQCDVTVLDGVGDLVKFLEGSDPLDVLVTDVDCDEIEAVLQSMQRLRPEVPVLAWTKSARAVAEHVLMTASVETYDVVARTARTSDVIELVRRLAGAD
jgi:hypothetical protein